jgi:hypothetical protein
VYWNYVLFFSLVKWQSTCRCSSIFFTAMPDQSGRTILCCSSGGANCVPHQTSAEISDRIGWRGKQVGSAALARPACAKLVQGARAVESPGFFLVRIERENNG